jgi:hypothetical protein
VRTRRAIYTDGMSRVGVCLMASVLVASVPLLSFSEHQRARSTARTPAPPPKPKTEPAEVRCPEQLGVGVKTKATFCFVLAGRDPVEGVIVTIPPHKDAILTFDLHNRHTYSEEETRTGRGFAKYTAVIGVLSMTGALLGRGAVQSEFRGARDLFDRISGGAGPGGMKAVAPLGREHVSIDVPAGVDQVSLLGELLDGTTPAGREVATPGRPVAIVSNLQVEYVPAPPAPPAKKR